MDIPICFFSQQRKDTSHQKNNFCRLWRVGTLQKERDPGWLMTEPSCFTQWFALHYMFGTIPWNGSEEDDPKKNPPQTVESCGDTLPKKQVPQQHSLQHPQNHHGWNLRSSPQQQKKWTHLQHHHCFGYSLWKFLGGRLYLIHSFKHQKI